MILGASLLPECSGLVLGCRRSNILGHVSGSRAGVVGIYQRHRFEAEKRAALEAWAREIDRIVHGGAGSYVITPPSATLALLPSAPTVEMIDPAWLEAIKHAETTSSFEPLLEFLRQPGVKLGQIRDLLASKPARALAVQAQDERQFCPRWGRDRDGRFTRWAPRMSVNCSRPKGCHTRTRLIEFARSTRTGSGPTQGQASPIS